jgi:hypothetical protein
MFYLIALEVIINHQKTSLLGSLIQIKDLDLSKLLILKEPQLICFTVSKFDLCKLCMIMKETYFSFNLLKK